jgi:hypothetical protein
VPDATIILERYIPTGGETRVPQFVERREG